MCMGQVFVIIFYLTHVSSLVVASVCSEAGVKKELKPGINLLRVPISCSGLIHGLIPKPCSSGQELLSKACPS